MGTMIAHVLIVFGDEAEITHLTEFSRSLRIHESIFGLSLLVAVVTFPIWILTACSRRFRLKTSEYFLQLVLYGMGCAAINFSPVLDPTRLANRLVSW